MGDFVSRGELYGLIRFGSQLDVFIPDTLVKNINVSNRDPVKAGETVLLETICTND